ncbi:MAG: lactate racemization operon protein LarA, partial [Lentisphaerae bacterium GWF2_52_8]
MDFQIPYGRGRLQGEIPDKNLAGIFESRVNRQRPAEGGESMIRQAIENPAGSERIEVLAKSADRAVIIASDHTRPVPSRLIFPQLLQRLRSGNPNIDISILIATGCHRASTEAELIGKFGEEIVATEKIFMHDCRAETEMASLGMLPSGGELKINRMALECELLLSEGFIEPHFFAGFSGGRKSVLPGISSEKTVMGNHCARFISDPNSRAGMLDGNPIHRDMLYAAEKAKLSFIVNVVINGNREVIKAVAGNPFEAHRSGCNFLKDLCRVSVPETEIVIVGNGGYPLDQNIYQSVKGMSAAESVCAPGGVIIMAAECSDTHGGESFYRMLSEAPSP